MAFIAGTLIMMADGTTQPVESLVVGSTIMGDDGTSRNVTAIDSGWDNIYKVTYRTGLSSFSCSSMQNICLLSTVGGTITTTTIANYLSSPPAGQIFRAGISSLASWYNSTGPVGPLSTSDRLTALSTLTGGNTSNGATIDLLAQGQSYFGFPLSAGNVAIEGSADQLCDILLNSLGCDFTPGSEIITIPTYPTGLSQALVGTPNVSLVGRTGFYSFSCDGDTRFLLSNFTVCAAP
jgi:hypothetical protein